LFLPGDVKLYITWEERAISLPVLMKLQNVASMLYSLLGTCKIHNVELYTYLKEILQITPLHPVNRAKELSPHHHINSPANIIYLARGLH
jgi:hypothetical protein